MTIAALALLLGGLWPFGDGGQLERSRYLIPAWHVETERDRFTGRMICRVFQGARRRPAVSYLRGTLAFAFPKHRSTLSADFSVDGGPTRPWTAVTPALVDAGLTLGGASMTNPTGGYVVLPAAVLTDAITVTIRSRPDDRPRTFSVGGLKDALASARRLGCDPDYGFTRAS